MADKYANLLAVKCQGNFSWQDMLAKSYQQLSKNLFILHWQ